MQMEESKGKEASMVSSKLKDYQQLMKFTLSFTVVFSSVVCYLLVPGIDFDIIEVLLLFAGGMLVTGAANAINQIAEKDTDAMMKRTASRPLASGRMTVDEAATFSVVAAVVGTFIIGLTFNWTAAGISGFSLFSLQFFWQFPHFWAIAWVTHEDYTRAGFRMLPSRGGPTKYAAVQAILYSVLLLPIGVLPMVFGMSGMVSMVVVSLANLVMVWQCIRLFREMDVKAARRVMFTSYIYLPVVLLALLADKQPLKDQSSVKIEKVIFLNQIHFTDRKS